MATATKSIASSRSTASRAIRTRPVRQNPSKSTKKSRIAIPQPQATRIVQRFIAGDSIRKIARDEHRDPKTVAKIVRSEEVAEYIRKTRERFYGLGEDALDAVRRALQGGDARLGYQLLKDIGAIPTAEEAALQRMQQSRPMAEGNHVKLEMWKLLTGAHERAKMYGQPVPCLDDFKEPLQFTRGNEKGADHDLE
jgi:hypothetical protein